MSILLVLISRPAAMRVMRYVLVFGAATNPSGGEHTQCATIVLPNGLRSSTATELGLGPWAAVMPAVRFADVSDNVAATLSTRLAYILLGGGAYLGEYSGRSRTYRRLSAS